MKGYVIVDVTVHDPVRYEEYKKMTTPSLLPYEGKFVVRGGASTTLEGTWAPGRIVVLEFPSVEHANAWWNSPEYADAKALRQETASTNMIIVTGV